MINVRFDNKPYHKPIYRLIATWADGYVMIASLPNGGVGIPRLLQQRFIQSDPISGISILGKPIIADTKAYIGHHQLINGSWYQQDSYQANRFNLSVSWSNKAIAFVVGFDALSVGTPSLIQQQIIKAQGIHQTAYGSHYALYGWQYAPIWYRLNVSWLGKTPKKPIDVTAFHVAWFIPSDAKQNIGAIGWQTGNFGTAKIINHHSHVISFGFCHTKFGTPHIDNKARILTVRGIYPPNVGTPQLINKTQSIYTGNLTSTLVFGKASIALKERFIQIKGLDSIQFGVAWLSHHLRYLGQIGHHSATLGAVRISHHTHIINPNGIYGDKGKDFASNHLVGGTQILNPDGFIATRWLTRIIPKNQVIGIEKGINGEFGIPSINNHRQYVTPHGFGFNDNALHGERFGKLQIYNLRQYITQYFIKDSGLTPQVIDPNDPNSISDFGKWTSITNKNRVIGAYGIDTLKFGYHSIDNTARVISPEPIVSVIGETMIAYRVRTLRLDGIEPPHFSYWHIIRNGARVIAPHGIYDSEFGKHAIASNKQFIKQALPYVGGEIGVAMIADRVRTLDIQWRYSIAPPTIALPTIENHTRYINPKGFDSTNGFGRKFGRAELMERFNIIRTHGRTHEVFGQEVIIRNLTPQLKLFGHNSAEFGEHSIRTQWRVLEAKGDVMTKIGLHRIADSKQTIKVDGIGANKIPTLHHIRKLNTPPYATQYIDLNKYIYDQQHLILILQKYGYGIEPPKYPMQVPAPKLQSNNILPEGRTHTEFGQVTIRTNMIEIPSGIAIIGVGEPRVWIKTQFIHATGIDNSIDDKKIGKPRLSPHTIYAPSSDMATAQAIRNHPLRQAHIINSMAVFGVADVANQHRHIYHNNRLNAHQGVMSVFGRASIEHKQKTISPVGFRGGYFGWHSIPFVPQTIEQYGDDHHTTFGQTAIAIANYDTKQYIRPQGLLALSTGLTAISHFHRHIYPQGKLMSRLGLSKSGDTPFMWQGLRIGERVLGSYGGFDSQVFGNAFVSNYIRQLDVQGFDSFVSESDIKSFKGRLKVLRVPNGVPKNGKKAQRIIAIGIIANTLNNPDIKNKVHYIRPDGNSEQFRKGAW